MKSVDFFFFFTVNNCPTFEHFAPFFTLAADATGAMSIRSPARASTWGIRRAWRERWDEVIRTE
jgi:hypothetical protein